MTSASVSIGVAETTAGVLGTVKGESPEAKREF
jgi:hypothetical protein